MTPNASLFQQVMGDEFRKLDPALQRFHSLQGRHELEGRVQTDAPQTWAARLLALTIGTPRTAHRALRPKGRFILSCRPVHRSKPGRAFSLRKSCAPPCRRTRVI